MESEKNDEWVASGGFGRVDKVEHEGVPVAKKTFEPLHNATRWTTIEKLKERFRREVEVQKGLPVGIGIPVILADLVADPPWFLMPLADCNFKKHLETEKKAASTLEALSEVLTALEKLHDLGHFHRDLKPSNILRYQGCWVLADFGLVTDPAAGELTNSFSAWGSAEYTSPEQFQDFRNAGMAADIYSFGCIVSHRQWSLDPAGRP